MIYWLAAYPRSGSNWLQQTLYKCFGIRDERYRDDPDSKRLLQEPSQATRLEMRESSDSYFLKTHALPPTKIPAGEKIVFCVRNPIATLESYHRWISSTQPDLKYSLEQILLDTAWDTEHIRCFENYMTHWISALESREHFVLKYEDRLKKGNLCLQHLSNYLGIDVKDWEQPNLEVVRKQETSPKRQLFWSRSAHSRDHAEKTVDYDLQMQSYIKHKTIFEYFNYLLPVQHN